MKWRIFLHVIVAVFISSCATTARIDKNFSIEPPYKVDKTLALETTAKDERNHWRDEVGRNTFTVFAIPSFEVKSRTRLENQMMINVKETLMEAGFKTNHVEYPRLEIIIDDFYFRNYTWLFPLYFFWGKIALSANLKDENEKILWTENFRGGSFLPGFVSFNPVIRRSMRKTLRDLQQACLREDFLEHLSD